MWALLERYNEPGPPTQRDPVPTLSSRRVSRLRRSAPAYGLFSDMKVTDQPTY